MRLPSLKKLCPFSFSFPFPLFFVKMVDLVLIFVNFNCDEQWLSSLTMGERIYGKRPDPFFGALTSTKSMFGSSNNTWIEGEKNETRDGLSSIYRQIVSRYEWKKKLNSFVWYDVLPWTQLGLFEASLDSSEYGTGSILLLKAGSICKGFKFEWNCFGSVLCSLVWTLSSFNTYMKKSSQCQAALDVDAHKSLARGVSNLSTTHFP